MLLLLLLLLLFILIRCDQEIAKKLMILMGAATEVRSSPTFKDVLNTLLSIGNAVEHKQAGGFDLEFLQRAESYKDSCHKKDLINHAAFCVIEKNPVSTNLYSDFPNVHDAWRVGVAVCLFVCLFICCYCCCVDGDRLRRTETPNTERTRDLVQM